MRKSIDTRLIRAQLTPKQQAFLRNKSARMHDYPDFDEADVETCIWCGVSVDLAAARTIEEAWAGCLPIVNLSDLLDIAKTRSTAAYTTAVSKLTAAGEPIDNVLTFLKAGF